MTLETWVKNTGLEKRDSDRDEIDRLLGLADGRLEDYRRAIAGKPAMAGSARGRNFTE